MQVVRIDNEFQRQALERTNDCPISERPAPYGNREDFPMAYMGFLAEVVIEFVLHRLRIPFIYSKGKTRFDYEIFRRLWEAKAQFTTMPPRLYYESNVSDLRYDHQLVFGYIFVSVECHKGHREDIYAYHTAYVCGACTRAHLEQHHVHHRKGETFRKCTFSYDCRSIRNALLTPVAHLERLSPLPA